MTDVMMDLRARYSCDECGDHFPDPVGLCAACKAAAEMQRDEPTFDGQTISF